MRRLVSFIVVFSVLFSISVPAKASYNEFLGIDESQYDMESYYYALWDNYNLNMNGILWEYVCGEQYYVYTQAVNRIGDDGWIEFASRLTEEELTKERYTEILINLIAMMDYNTTELIDNQVEADSLKEFGDYAADATGILVQTISLDAAFGLKATEPMKRIATALNLTWGGVEFTIDTIETFRYLDRILQQYSNYEEFLNSIIKNAADETLKAAASGLLSVVDKVFFSKVNAVTEVSGNLAEYLGQTVFFDTIVLEYMITDASILDLSDSDIETIGFLKSAYEYLGTLPLAAELGTFAADMLLGISDVMNRYNEMCALTKIRNALIMQMDNYRNNISGAGDIQEIGKLCQLMKNLIYVNFRGEYCAHETLTQDAQAYSLIIKINGHEQTIDRVFERAKENTCVLVETVEYYIFPMLELHKVADAQTDISTSFPDCYIAVLENHPETVESAYGTYAVSFDTEWALYDIDKNGVPELIVREEGNNYYIYTCEAGTAKLCGNYYWPYADCLREYNGNGIVVHDGGWGSMRLEYVYLYTLNGGELRMEDTIASMEECSYDEMHDILDTYSVIDSFSTIKDFKSDHQTDSGTKDNANNVISGVGPYDIEWMLDSQGTLTIGGNGEMKDCDPVVTGAGWLFENILSTTEEIEYDQIKKIVVSGSILRLGESAFSMCSSVETVVIEEGITEIGAWAFLGNSSLKTIYLPESLETIHNLAVYNCPQLTDVYYAGDESSWNNVKVLGDNSSLMDATIHYGE